MTDIAIALIATWTALCILLYAYRLQGQELAEETRQRRRWQAIAHDHADHAKRWKNLAERAQGRQERWERLYTGQTLPHDRPDHPRCRCVMVPDDHTPVTYTLINGELTKPYAIGKSPFHTN